MRHILMVEDNNGDKILLQTAFTEAGLVAFDIDQIDNGQVACDAMLGLQRAPDLIILDINLPGRNGWDVLECIRNAPGLIDSAVVLFSSCIDVVTVNKALHQRCPILGKPMSFDGYVKVALDMMSMMDSQDVIKACRVHNCASCFYYVAGQWPIESVCEFPEVPRRSHEERQGSCGPEGRNWQPNSTDN